MRAILLQLPFAPSTSLPFRVPPLVPLALAFAAGLLAVALIGMGASPFGLLLWTAAAALLPLGLRPLPTLATALLSGVAGSALLLLMTGHVEPSRALQLELLAALAVAFGLLLQRQRALMAERDELQMALTLRNALGDGFWAVAGDGLELLDESGRVLAANPAALALWQADEAALRRQSWLERWGRGAHSPVQEGWLEMTLDGRAEFETSVRAFAGDYRQLAVTLQALKLPNGACAVLCRCRDITVEHAQRHQLATRSAELELLLDAIDEGFMVVDRHATIRYLNRHGARLLRRDCDALVGRNFWELIPAQYQGQQLDLLRRAIVHREAGELRAFHPLLQRWLLLRVTPAADGATLLFRDITLEVETEEARSEHLVRLQVEQELAGVAGWQFDFGDGLLRLSPKAFELLGLAECEPAEHKRRLLELLHPADRMPLVQGLISCSQPEHDDLLDVTTRMPVAGAAGRFRHLRWLARRAECPTSGNRYLVGAVQDVSAAIEARERWGFLGAALDALPNDVCVIDSQGAVVALNHSSDPSGTRARRFDTLSAGDNLLQRLADVSGSNRPVLATLRQGLEELLCGPSGHFQLEYALQLADGEYWYSTDASLLVNDGQRFAVLSHTDITERHVQEERLYRAANFDPLTALPNREALYQQLTLACGNNEFALLLIDLDRFQNFNDSFGGHGGDLLLKLVARRIEDCLPQAARLYRLASDEFVALLPEGTLPQPIAELILAALANSFELEQVCVFVSASIGAAQFPHDGRDSDSLLSAAGAALAQVKANGRNGYRRFEPGQRVMTRELVQLETELHAALEREEFELFYQAKYQLAAAGGVDMLLGAEALLRWRSPTRGLVSPAEFIPLLEQCGLIGPVGDWVLREACRQLAEWYRDSGLWLSLAVNVSPLQLANPTFVATARAIRDAAGIPAGQLELEITESLLMRDIERGAQLVRELREAGFRVALDDFGTGYSSLSYLRSLALDTLKIDRSFIAALDAVSGTEIVAGMIHIARALQMQVVAEGVETAAQLDTLRTLGCDSVQGFLLGRPLPAAAFRKMALPCESGCDAALRRSCRTAPCLVWQTPTQSPLRSH